MCKRTTENPNAKRTRILLSKYTVKAKNLKCWPSSIWPTATGCLLRLMSWTILSWTDRETGFRMRFHRFRMRPASTWGESWWRTRKSENGPRRRTKSKRCIEKAWNWSSRRSFKDKLILQIRMPNVLRTSRSGRLSRKTGWLPKYKEKRSNFSESC